MTDRFVIGIDYGTLSARAVVCRTSDGAVMGEAESVYPHAILYDHLPDGTPLPPEWALQHPQDYLDALYTSVPAAMKQSGVPRDSVIGIAVDFTGSTPMLEKHAMPRHHSPERSAARQRLRFFHANRPVLAQCHARDHRAPGRKPLQRLC